MKKSTLLMALIFFWADLYGQNFTDWASTPPMGWNNWDCYGPTVIENEVKANADYMAKYLKGFGWDYIVVDIRWYVENDKECIEHTEGASVAFLVFTRDPAGPLPSDSVRVPVKFEQLGLHGACSVKDLWSNNDLGIFNDEFSPCIKRHGAGLYKISVKK